jgi:hypothetical protein
MKLSNWQPAFCQYMMETLNKPFKWGEHDCVTMARDVVVLVTGEDPLNGLSWSSEAEAALTIAGYGSLGSAVEAHLYEGVPWGACAEGDLVLARSPGIEGVEMLCVHDGTQLLAPDIDGLRVVPFRVAVKGWVL